MTTTPKTIRMVDTLTQYAHIREEVDAAIREVVESGMYIRCHEVFDVSGPYRSCGAEPWTAV